MAHKYKIIIAVLAAALIAGAGLWFWRAGPDEIAFPRFDLTSLFAGQEPDSDVLSSATLDSETFKLLNIYTNPDYGFSFNYPEGLQISEFGEEQGRVILVGDKFQIYVSAFDEPGPLTPERIREDLPNIVIENPQVVTLGGKTSDVGGKTSDVEERNVTALVFFGRDPSLGKTREVWFAYSGYLYQVSSLAEFDAQLSKILKTWQFQ